MTRTPIAIVGASCVLPGANSVDAFAKLVLSGTDAVRQAPEGRFGIPNAAVLGEGRDRAWSLAGGYVTDFEPSLDGLAIPDLPGLDPLTRWLLHCSKEALGSAGGERTGAVFGNLSFPTDGMAEWGEGVARGKPAGDPRNHFMSGLPAAIVAKALGLDAGATCLDAACASSLYAIKLACDALEYGRADRMLAGAVQRADSLFLHIGFCQLGAMSKTGQSRPFHALADGLIPAEGCVVFNLRRLDDAVAANEPIWGVIRGIGLSNDGRARSLLAPSSEGQVRAMRSALREADWAPESVQLFECHATGTPTGDRAELDSLQAVYPGGYLGSFKSNVGHLITAAGAAGLLKVLIGMRERVMPKTLHAEAPIGGLGNFTLLNDARPWNGVCRAAVSAFGFGGNNAHLLVEEHRPAHRTARTPARVRKPLAIVAISEARGGANVALDLSGIRFPPSDLKAALAQQIWMLQCGREAFSQSRLRPARERLGAFIGMGTDGQVTRWGLRWRSIANGILLAEADRIAPPLRAEHVVGTMPNIVANRLGVQLDAAGPGFTLSADELSGLRALEAAWDALDRGELDAALVGAVDLSREKRALAARKSLGASADVEDAVVALVVVRAADAPDGDILAYLDEQAEGPVLSPRKPGHGAAEALTALVDAIRRGGQSVLQIASLGDEQATIGIRTGKKRLESAFLPIVGASLTLPLHPEEPTLRRQDVPMTGTTRMPLPPPLVSALARPAPRTGEALTSPVQPAAPSPALDIGPEPPGNDPLAAAFMAHTAATASAHQVFLSQQSALHEAFVANHARNAVRVLGIWSDSEHAGFDPTVQVEQAQAFDPEPAPFAAPTHASSRHPEPPKAEPVAAPARERKPVPGLVAPAALATETVPPKRPAPSGFSLSRSELEMGACGSISTIFGAEFAELDGYRRVVRMPEPPLLLADRVTDLQGPCRVLGKGSIVTETDIREDSWYLHDGRMPGGLMIESGQADLLLGSWQGIDWLNQGERIYRLLGCTLTYKGELPKIGETLRYDIHIDQHAKLGDVRMFFFRYDCHVGEQHRLSVREGQAGFFTDEELADSGGCLWDAATHDPGRSEMVVPVARPDRTEFAREQLDAIANGDLEAAFGGQFARAHTHTRTPKIAGGKTTLFDRAVVELEGGPWRRGYLKAELDIRPDLWFFNGHFHNDPCMPGTLMFDGCLNAMYLFLTAGGHTLHRDGWRFEPGKEIPFKLRCRGQVTPTSKRLTYEIFVTELIAGPIPKLTAQVLCTVDGLKCFHADPMVVELVPGWPLDRLDVREKSLPKFPDNKPVAFGYESLLACAWGRPTDAFGPMYAPFDGPRKVPRLPGPPYHFMSRVLTTTGEMGGKKADCSATVEYDVPPDAWYFKENGHAVMPWAVLLEAALQPCGWLASWTGSAVGPDDFLFRNLDGSATVHREVTPTTGTLTTLTKLDRVSKSGGMILVNFTVAVDSAQGRVLDMKTVFGFFPPEAFVNQVGVGSTEIERARLSAPAAPIPIQSGIPVATGRLMMLDRAFRVDADTYRGEKDVSPKDWFFAAHFYQDPVQPGSLGIEALLQLLQVAMADRGLGSRFARPRFEPTANGETQVWKYRGQVVPENKRIQSELRIIEIKEEESATLAIAEGGLWVDGKRIYAVPKFAIRVREDDQPQTVLFGVPADHRPTWTVPAAPMMTMALAALTAGNGGRLTDGAARRWLTFPNETPVSVAVRFAEGIVGLGPEDSPYFTAKVASPAQPAPALPELLNPVSPPQSADQLYASGALFHGPSFHALDSIVAIGENGASGTLRPNLAPDVLLDGMTHLVPHDNLRSWFSELPPGNAAYPAKLLRLELLGPLPLQTSRVEVRSLRVEKGRPVVGAWLFAADKLVVYFELEEVLLPKGRIGSAAPADRRDFLQRRYVSNVSLSTFEGSTAKLSAAEVRGSNWLPGTVATVLGSENLAVLAVKETVGRKLGAHPGLVELGDPGERIAYARTRPLHTVPYRLVESAQNVEATPGQVIFPDVTRVGAWWRSRLGTAGWPGERVLEALCIAYCADFVVDDPEALSAIKTPILFLANHENYLESVLFAAIAAATFGRPIRAVAKVEHQTRWLGRLHALMTGYPGVRQEPQILWFDQANPGSLRPTLDAAPAGASLLVHVEGSRHTHHGEKVSKISSVWTDFAVERGWPIVPVAFRGGVAGAKTDVPIAPQRHHVGSPILPAQFRALPYADRRQTIANAINALPHGPVPETGTTKIENPGAAIVAAVESFAPGALDAAHPAWAARFRAL